MLHGMGTLRIRIHNNGSKTYEDWPASYNEIDGGKNFAITGQVTAD